jgi:hypothetical protein
MARIIWRYTMTPQEQKLWETEEMKGWREAMEGCVEDDAREKGCKKYVIYDRSEAVVVKGEVMALPEPDPVHT